MKATYYYIDESGGINSNSNFFILGCFKTDSPEDIRLKINSLQTNLINDGYFAFEREKILAHGFHATENHFDVRARFFGLISTLNIRAYVLLLNKKSKFFKSLNSEDHTSDKIYNQCIKKLLSDRLIKTRRDNNIIIFEQFGSKPHNWLKNVESVVSEIGREIKTSFDQELKHEVKVHDKRDVNLSVVDYINFLFSQIYEHRKTEPRMLQNFKIIEPKIGLVYKMDQDVFHDKNKRLDISRY